MILDVNDACEIIYDDHEDWEVVKGTEQITDHSRWAVAYSVVVKHIPSGKFYHFDYDVGATESQDMDCKGQFGYSDTYEPIEVHQVEKTIKVWESVPKTENA